MMLEDREDDLICEEAKVDEEYLRVHAREAWRTADVAALDIL